MNRSTAVRLREHCTMTLDSALANLGNDFLGLAEVFTPKSLALMQNNAENLYDIWANVKYNQAIAAIHSHNEVLRASAEIGSADAILANRLDRHDMYSNQNMVLGLWSLVNTHGIDCVVDNLTSSIDHVAATYNRALANYILFGLARSYIASHGDEKFLCDVPISIIPTFLEPEMPYSGTLINNPGDSITCADYVVLWQFAKNAKSNFGYGIHHMLPGQTQIIVSDDGPGFVDAQGNPIPIEQIPCAFDPSRLLEQHNGTGLKVSSRIAALRGPQSYIWLLSTSKTEEGRKTISYRTSDASASRFQETMSMTGSKLILNVPRIN